MKHTMYRYFLLTTIGFCLLLLTACSKRDDFLNAKPNEALAVPNTLKGLQLLLQNEDVFNRNYSCLGEVSSDEFYLSSSTWTALSLATERNAYIWAPQPFYDAGYNVDDWGTPYNRVYYANTILDALGRISISPAQQSQYNQVKGSALFFRAYAFYDLLQLFTLPYDSSAAATLPGIPLRLNAGLTATSVRASERESYNQVLADLRTALTLLPVTATYNTQPTQAAANALLARVYLVMGHYDLALQYANTTLSFNNTLNDYNQFSSSATQLTAANSFLTEDIFHATLTGYSSLSTTRQIIDSGLYKSYDNNDLRKTAFFFTKNGDIRFKGSYDLKRVGVYFCGLATDEIYLIRAECYARSGNSTDAMNDLNTLLVNRYKKGSFTRLTATDATGALRQVLLERKKELLFRGIRWTDLRRLNKDSRYAVTLTRIINNNVYTLPPDDPRYALPIPDNEITLSGLVQNNR